MPRKRDLSFDPYQAEIISRLRRISEEFTLEIEQVLGKGIEDICTDDIPDLADKMLGLSRETDFIFSVGELVAIKNIKDCHEKI